VLAWPQEGIHSSWARCREYAMSLKLIFVASLMATFVGWYVLSFIPGRTPRGILRATLFALQSELFFAGALANLVLCQWATRARAARPFLTPLAFAAPALLAASPIVSLVLVHRGGHRWLGGDPTRRGLGCARHLRPPNSSTHCFEPTPPPPRRLT